MIVFLSTRAHRYTHRDVQRRRTNVRILAYDRAFKAKALRAATYIFTDIDRLGFWEIELASELYRVLRTSGCRVLNDPARVLQRYALLKKLKTNNFNTFDVWRPDEGVLPDRYPVFLRTQSAHRGVLSSLLHSDQDAQSRLEHAVEAGFPLSDLMFVEFCAEPIAPGVYLKHAAYRIGTEVTPAVSVLTNDWIAKTGWATAALGRAESEFLANLKIEIVEELHGADIQEAFLLGEIEYGRADFSLVRGEVEVYEINTNPLVAIPTIGKTALTSELLLHINRRYLSALEGIDDRSQPRMILLDSERLTDCRRQNFALARTLATP